jgi:hypothetical protein
MPGGIVAVQETKLNGHKGIRTYHQNAGEGITAVAVIGEYEPKSKVRTYQASQHVGNQAKSGPLKVFRVLES